MALIHNVPSGSMNDGIEVAWSNTPAMKPATRAIATCAVGRERSVTGGPFAAQ
jgi:hypothetical protein